MMVKNETHSPELTSWVDSANSEHSDFPIQNLPFAVFRRKCSGEAFRGGVAIGDFVLDLAAVESIGLFSGDAQKAVKACSESKLNTFMALGQRYWSTLRLELSKALRSGSKDQTRLQGCLIPQADIEFDVPCHIGDYTDFYTSVHHATAVGSLFRPDNPLLPNYKWVPIGYHGRASSIVISGTDFIRPAGQTKTLEATEPSLNPCARLDYELEVGIYIGTGNDLGSPVTIEDSESHVFGLCLFNDWSARDIQAWEYQPLGPFLSKNFFSTVSPWIVTMEALIPFRSSWSRDEDDPQPLPYLDSDSNRAQGAIDIQLEAYIETAQMRSSNSPAEKLSNSSFIHSYWSIAQMVTHHTVNGCNMRPGDLLGSGTQSGPLPEEAGSLLELSQGGKKPFSLGNGEQRTFLEDGDRVIFKGFCNTEGNVRIGFGDVSGTVVSSSNS